MFKVSFVVDLSEMGIKDAESLIKEIFSVAEIGISELSLKPRKVRGGGLLERVAKLRAEISELKVFLETIKVDVVKKEFSRIIERKEALLSRTEARIKNKAPKAAKAPKAVRTPRAAKVRKAAEVAPEPEPVPVVEESAAPEMDPKEESRSRIAESFAKLRKRRTE